MSKFIVSVMGAVVFFVGLGALADNVGARFKSDEKALEIIGRARLAIGGDAAIAEVRSMVIKGQTTHMVKIGDTERIEQGEAEIALQLPDRMMKMVKLGNADGSAAEHKVLRQHNVTVFMKDDGGTAVLPGGDADITTGNGRKVIVRTRKDGNAEWKAEGGEAVSPEGKDIEIVHAGSMKAAHGGHGNELLRTTLSLLVSAPEGMDVTYKYAGTTTIDGTSAEIIEASAAGTSFKLFIDQYTSLPVGISFMGHPAPIVVKMRRDGTDVPEKDVVMFAGKLEGPGESTEHFVRYSDFRVTNGIQLPYKWTTTVNGQQRGTFDVISYEVNPANIAERFEGHKVFVRQPKPNQN
jgi:hypothetical protein